MDTRDVPEANFDGPDYVPALDKARLTGQIWRVYTYMSDGRWRTLREIAAGTNDPESSISAQLRHLRKKKFGEHLVEKRRRGNREAGLFEYKLTPNRRE
jgi:hypothetical protein